MAAILLLHLATISLSEEYTADTEYQYDGLTIDCTDYSDCILNCFETRSCRNSTIVGPYNATLTINCNNKNGQGMTCEFMTIYAQNSSQLNLNIYGYQNGAQIDLYNTDIYTPFINTSSYATNTIIKCGVVDPNNNNEQYTESCSYRINIFSQNGWTSVSWSYVADKSWYLSSDSAAQSTMFCGAHYQNQCKGWKVDGIYYRCTDSQSLCDYHRIGTLNPTPSPLTTQINIPSATQNSTVAISQGYFEQCIKEFSILDGDGAISIDIDKIGKKMKITLRGPTDKWFGIGFGGNVMSEIYAITVSGNDIDIKQWKLGNHKSGQELVNIFDEVSGDDVALYRIVTMVRDWNEGYVDIYDFTDFFECKIKTLKIIWAQGYDVNFGYHGDGEHRNNLLELVSCGCNGTESTDKPTLKPIETVETGCGYQIRLSFIHYVFMFCLFVCVVYSN